MENQGEKSLFNEALGQMKRLHELQDQVNFCNSNLLMFDSDFNKYHYEIKFETVCSLFMEASSKMSTKEIEEAEGLRKDIKYIINDKQILWWVTDDETGTRTQMFNQEEWIKLEEKLFQFELKVRKYLEEHNLTSPKAQDPTKAILH